MDADGQVYFAPEDEIPGDDVERYKKALREEIDANLEKLRVELTTKDLKAQVVTRIS
jgi:hypothetical protein